MTFNELLRLVIDPALSKIRIGWLNVLISWEYALLEDRQKQEKVIAARIKKTTKRIVNLENRKGL